LLEDIDFAVTKSFGEHNTFVFDALFNEGGLYGADLFITVSFSLQPVTWPEKTEAPGRKGSGPLGFQCCPLPSGRFG
jgi:hypothetical protein